MEKEIFEKLKVQYNNIDKDILAEQYPNLGNHKIGIDSSLQPIILIFANNHPSYRVAPRKLELIDIAFNQLCKVNDITLGSTEERFTILKLKSDNSDLQNYFFKICNLILSTLGSTPNVEDVHQEVLKIIKLFSNLQSPPKNTIQGLFAELIIINESTNPDALIEAWHPNNNDLDDFNDGKCSLEIKSTTKSGRLHTFSHNQLINKNEYSYVASILIKYSGIGTSLNQLAEKIEIQLVSIKNKIKLNELITDIIGKDYFKSSEIKFDYGYSASSVKFFKTKNISHIKPDAIPIDISKLNYCVDLSYKEKSDVLINEGFFSFISS